MHNETTFLAAWESSTQSNGTLISEYRYDAHGPYRLPSEVAEEDHPYLGFGGFPVDRQTRIINNVSKFPALQALPRPRKLPGKVRVILKKRESQELVEMLWYGKITFGITVAETHIFVEARDDDDDDENRFIARYWYFMNNCSTRFDLAEELEFDVSWEQKNQLLCRMLHLLLRNFAFMMPCYFLSRILFGKSPVGQRLATRNRKDEYLDWVTMRADLALNFPFPVHELTENEVHARSMVDVAKALGTVEKWDQGACVCMEIGECFESVLIQLHASKCFINAHDFDLSLEMLQKATEIHRRFEASLAVTRRKVQRALLRIHKARTIEEMRHPKPDFNVLVGGTAVIGLLVAAGEHIEGQCDSFFTVDGFLVKDLRDSVGYLKKKFRKASSAANQLMKLCFSKSVSEYNKTLKSCVDPTCSANWNGPSDADRSDCQSVHEARRNQAKKSAEEGVKIREGKMKASCASCDGDVGSLRCPCAKVFYCSTECQGADWERHKRLCGYHKRRQEWKDRKSCSVCGKKMKKTRERWCPCEERFYCGKECQNTDWSDNHKRDCKWSRDNKNEGNSD